MTDEPHANPGNDGAAPAPGRGRGRLMRRTLRPWRIGTPFIVLACGVLFVTSAESSQGTDLRPGRYTDLASLVGNEAQRVEALNERAAELDGEVSELTEQVPDSTVERYQRRADALEGRAGLEPVSGEGVTVVLADAPETLIESTEGDVNPLVVHQQDIQAVLNAMWAGGARAVTVQGQRVITTTGIKCEGNSVQLQGVPYPQPYVIQAVGDQEELLDSIGSDRYLQGYRLAAADPEIQVGWELLTRKNVEAPAYDGLLDIGYAEPMA